MVHSGPGGGGGKTDRQAHRKTDTNIKTMTRPGLEQERLGDLENLNFCESNVFFVVVLGMFHPTKPRNIKDQNFSCQSRRKMHKNE